MLRDFFFHIIPLNIRPTIPPPIFGIYHFSFEVCEFFFSEKNPSPFLPKGPPFSKVHAHFPDPGNEFWSSPFRNGEDVPKMSHAEVEDDRSSHFGVF